MEPLDDKTLAELEKTDPELVRQYRERMATSRQAVGDAQRMQDVGSYANVAGRLLNDLNNSQKRDVVLKNRIQDLGKAPTVQKATRPGYDDSIVNNLTAQAVGRAKEQRAQDLQDFNEEQKLTDLSANRADQKLAWDKAARENDPTSEDSKLAREYLKQISPDAAKIPGFDNLSAAQAMKIAPGLMESNRLKEAAAARRDNLAQARLSRQDAIDARKGMKEDEHDWKEEQTRKAVDEKKKTLLNEVEDRRTNILQNLDILDKMIEDKGTWELTGSHNQDIDRLVDQIATDMAKLQDPSSVARPAEVEAVRKNLISSGFGNSNSTARQILQNFRSEVDRRADSAYAIRGIEKSGKAGTTGPLHGSDLPD